MRAVRVPREQSRRWMFTVNNYTQIHEVELTLLGPNTTYLVYGKEIAPTTGTPHLQGFVIFQTNQSLRAVRELIHDAHLTVARESSRTCAEYCKKDQTDIVEFGTLPNDAGATNQYINFRDWIMVQETKPTVAQVAYEFPAIYHRSNKVAEFIDFIFPNTPSDPGEFRPYQRDLAEVLGGEADPRKIIFVVDPVGNSGKSWFTEKMLFDRPNTVQILSAGRNEDIAHALDPSKSIFLFDLPRSAQEHFQYRVVEQLKNRRVFSPKYNSQMKVLDRVPHVCVFTNEYPDMTKLSHDRYDIIVWNAEP